MTARREKIIFWVSAILVGMALALIINYFTLLPQPVSATPTPPKISIARIETEVPIPTEEARCLPESEFGTNWAEFPEEGLEFTYQGGYIIVELYETNGKTSLLKFTENDESIIFPTENIEDKVIVVKEEFHFGLMVWTCADGVFYKFVGVYAQETLGQENQGCHLPTETVDYLTAGLKKINWQPWPEGIDTPVTIGGIELTFKSTAPNDQYFETDYQGEIYSIPIITINNLGEVQVQHYIVVDGVNVWGPILFYYCGSERFISIDLRNIKYIPPVIA